jgi:hypothetical protein
MAPNIVNVTTITGKTAVLAVTDSVLTLVENTAGSSKVFKLNALYLANAHTGDVDVDVEVYRSSTSYYVVKAVTLSTKSTLDVLSKPLYLEEGDAIRVVASVTSVISAVSSYEEIS